MMLKKLAVLFATVGLLSSLALSASAGVFLPQQSTLEVNLGALPTVTVTGKYQYGGWATLSNNGGAHDLTDLKSIWKDAGVSVGTSLLTGVALITRLTLTETNQSGAFTASFSTPNPVGGNLSGTDPNKTTFSNTLCPGGCLGGVESFNGQFIVGIVGTPLPFPLSVVGVGGQASLPVGQAAIVATGAPFVTGKVKITNITTNVISLSLRNGGAGAIGLGVTLNPAPTENAKTFTTGLGFVTDHPGATNLETRATVTLEGDNNLASASGTGQVTLISPLRIQTGPLGVGNIPGKFSKTFAFVPEPGTVLLLVSGAAGLVFIGRKRMKR
jgi:hypothetical protein